MNADRKKELLEEYKNRQPQMGVISVKCMENNESFLGISKDTGADFNSIRTKLSMNYHPNKRLQELWNQYGKEKFDFSVLKTLEYGNSPAEDYTAKLEALREGYLDKDENASKIWR